MFGKQSKLERPQEWVVKPWGEDESFPPLTLASPFACCSCVTSLDSPKWRTCSPATCIEDEAMEMSVFYHCIWAFPCCCCSVNPSLCCLLSFLLYYVAVSRFSCMSEFTLTGPHNMLIGWAYKLSVWKILGRENLILAYPVIFIKEFCMNNRV